MMIEAGCPLFDVEKKHDQIDIVGMGYCPHSWNFINKSAEIVGSLEKIPVEDRKKLQALCLAWRGLAEVLNSRDLEAASPENLQKAIDVWIEKKKQVADLTMYRNHYNHLVEDHSVEEQRELRKYNLTLADMCQESLECSNKDHRHVFHTVTSKGGGKVSMLLQTHTLTSLQPVQN